MVKERIRKKSVKRGKKSIIAYFRRKYMIAL